MRLADALDAEDGGRRLLEDHHQRAGGRPPGRGDRSSTGTSTLPTLESAGGTGMTTTEWVFVELATEVI